MTRHLSLALGAALALFLAASQYAPARRVAPASFSVRFMQKCALVVRPNQFDRVPELKVVYRWEVYRGAAGPAPGYWVLLDDLQCE